MSERLKILSEFWHEKQSWSLDVYTSSVRAIRFKEPFTVRIAASQSWPLAATAALALCFAPAPAAEPTGKAAPPLVVTTLNGASFDLRALHGRVVVVNFWATWCPPCRDEMPVMDAFYREYHGRGVELIGISLDRRRDLRVVEKVMQPFAFPAALWNGATVNGFAAESLCPAQQTVRILALRANGGNPWQYRHGAGGSPLLL